MGRAKTAKTTEDETQPETVVAWKGWRGFDPFDAILRMFPPKDWAAVVFGNCDARPVRMEDLDGSETLLWGHSRNITQREAKRRCATFREC